MVLNKEDTNSVFIPFQEEKGKTLKFFFVQVAHIPPFYRLILSINAYY